VDSIKLQSGTTPELSRQTSELVECECGSTSSHKFIKIRDATGLSTSSEPDNSNVETDNTIKRNSYMVNDMPGLHSTLKEDLENPSKSVEQVFITPPHMRLTSGLQSTLSTNVKAIKFEQPHEEHKSGIVVDNRLVLSPTFLELKNKSTSSHNVSSCPKIMKDINSINSATRSNLPTELELSSIVNVLEAEVDRKTTTNYVNPKVIQSTVDRTDISNTSFSSSQALSDSQQLKSTTLSSHGKAKTCKPVDFSSRGKPSDEENLKLSELKSKTELNAGNKPMEEIDNAKHEKTEDVEAAECRRDTHECSNSKLSTNPFAEFRALKFTNPFDSCKIPSMNIDTLTGENPVGNSNARFSNVEIRVSGDCIKNKLATSVEQKLSFLKVNQDKKPEELRSGKKYTKNVNDSTIKIPVGVANCKSNIAVESTKESKGLCKLDDRQILPSVVTNQTLLNDKCIKTLNTVQKLPTKTDESSLVSNRLEAEDNEDNQTRSSQLLDSKLGNPLSRNNHVEFESSRSTLFEMSNKQSHRESIRDGSNNVSNFSSQPPNIFLNEKIKVEGTILTSKNPRQETSVQESASETLFSSANCLTTAETTTIPSRKNTYIDNNMQEILAKRSENVNIDVKDEDSQSLSQSFKVATNSTKIMDHRPFNENIKLHHMKNFYSFEVSENFICNITENETPFAVEFDLCFRNLKTSSEECVNRCIKALLKALKSKLRSSGYYSSIKVNEIIATESNSSDKDLIVIGFEISLMYNDEAERLVVDLQKRFFEERLQNMIEENLNEKVEFRVQKFQIHPIPVTDSLDLGAPRNFRISSLSMCSKLLRGFGLVTNMVSAQTVWEQPNTLFALLCFWLALFNIKKGFFYGVMIYNSALPDIGAIFNAIGLTFLLISCFRYGIFFYISRARNELALRLPSTVFCLDQALLVIGYTFVIFGDIILALRHWNTEDTLPDTHWHTLLQPSPNGNINICRAVQFWPIVIYCWMTLILISRRTGTVTVEWFTVSISLILQSAVFFPNFRDILVWFMFCSFRYNIWTILGLLGSSLKIIAILMSMHVQVMGSLNHPSLKYIFYPYAIIFFASSLLNNAAFSVYTIYHLELNMTLFIHMQLDAFLFLCLDFLAFAGILLIFRLSDPVRRRKFQIKNSSITCDVSCKRERKFHVSQARQAAAVVVGISDFEQN
jgi:hypothetical protein